jgi:molecular chaperone GrpE
MASETNADNESATDAALEAVAEHVTAQSQQNGDQSAASLARVEADLIRTKMDLLKSQAEFENFRKRIRRDAEEEMRYAALPLIRELLPVMDNLERATDAANQAGTAGGLVDGVKLVMNQFNTALSQQGCVRIEALGAEFDPNLHQALAQEASTEHAAGQVSRVLQAGYKLHDRVVRPAQVFVSTGPAK